MRSLALSLLLVSLCAAKPKPRDIRFRVSVPPRARQRVAYRDADWKKLRRLLLSGAPPESDKRRWTTAFLVAYWRSPGVEPGMAEILSAHVPPCRMREALRVLARSGGLPGFGAANSAEPSPADPLEALLLSKAKEYDAAKAAVEKRQLDALQGAPEDPASIRRQLAELAPLEKDFCELSGEYAEKHGPLALKGLLAKENLLEPLNEARCP